MIKPEGEQMNFEDEPSGGEKAEVSHEDLGNAIREKINDLLSRMTSSVSIPHFRMLVGGQVRDAVNKLGFNVGDMLGTEQQEIMLKARIHSTTDEDKLKILEQNIDASPVLQKEIQERKYQIRAENR